MAHTDVTLTNEDGVLVPSADSVSVVSGDTVSFATADGSAAFVFFSPDAISVLSPKPDSAFEIAAGTKAEFSFTASKPGAYSAYFAGNAGGAPGGFLSGNSTVLQLEIQTSDLPPFPGPGDTVGSGH